MPWPEWAITTRVDTSAHWRQVWRAVACHRSQLPEFRRLNALPDGDHATLWEGQTFYRALSLVNSGRALEDDLFAGVRSHALLQEEPRRGASKRGWFAFAGWRDRIV